MTSDNEKLPKLSLAALAGVPRALCLVWDTHHGLTLALGGTTLLQALMPAAAAWVGKLVIDGVVQAMSHSTNGLSRIGPLVGLALVLALAGQVLNSLAQVSQDLLRDLLGQRINTMIVEKAITLDLSYYETPAFYDMLQRAQQEAGYRPLAMVQQLLALVRGAITLLSFVALLLRFSPWMVLALVVTGLPALFVQSAYGRASFRMYSRRAPAWRKLIYLGLLLTDKHFVKEVKLFGLARTLLGRYEHLYAQFYRENCALSIRRNVGNLGLQLLALLGYYGGYLAVILQAIGGHITLGDLTMYSGVLMQAQSTAGALMSSLADLYEQNLFLSNLFTFLKLQPRIPPGGRGEPAPEILRSGLEMRNVTFQYPGISEPVLHNINLWWAKMALARPR
jgi:ATP-binding cassette subfamily B protein